MKDLLEYLQRFGELVTVVKQNLPDYRYSFMGSEQFLSLGVPKDVNRVYTQEVLFRAHSAALTTIFRNGRWMKGIISAIEGSNYFSFCACLRGLIEAAADAHVTLLPTCHFLAEHFATIKDALDGRMESKVIQFHELEDILIHYSHARKVARGEDVPDSHRVKPARQYLEAIEEPGSNKVRELYAELCEITHPAALTVHMFWETKNSTNSEIALVDPDDKGFIIGLASRHSSSIATAFFKSFNPAFLTLYTLNRLDDERVMTPGMRKINLSTIPAFVTIEKNIKESRSVWKGIS